MTNAKGTFSEGPAKCAAEGGIFVPPVSGLDWAKVMLALNNNLNDQAFPDMGLGTLSSSQVEHVKNIPQQKAWVAWEHKEDSASRSTLFSANQLRFPRTIWKDSASVFEESTKTQMLNILGNSTYGFMLNPDASNSNDTRTAKRLSYGLMYANGVPITTPGNVRKPPLGLSSSLGTFSFLVSMGYSGCSEYSKREEEVFLCGNG